MKILMAKSFALIMCIVLCACSGDTSEQRAEDLLKQAREQFDGGRYEESLLLIDSLRKTYPQAIEARKQALKLHQDAELVRAQKDLEKVDGELTAAKDEYERLRVQAEKSKSEGLATADQLTALTRMRMRRDSLQVRFDMQCAKIKYIHKKQKE